MLGRLHEKQAVKLGLWVQIQRLFRGPEKPGKSLIRLAGGRTFRMQDYFQLAVRPSSTRTLTDVSTRVAALFLKTYEFVLKTGVYIIMFKV